MRLACPACNYPNPTEVERCQGCGALIGTLRSVSLPATRKTPKSDVPVANLPPTRPVPRNAPKVRAKKSELEQPVDTDLIRPFSMNAGSLQRWAGIPENAPDGTHRFYPHNSNSLYALVCFGPQGLPNECHVLRCSETVLGRDEGSIQIINDTAVSGRHAQLSYRDDMSLVLTDLNSTNGTFIRISSHQGYRLWDGCSFIIGRQLLTFRSTYQAAPARARAQTTPIATIAKSENSLGMLLVANAPESRREYQLTGPTVIGRARDGAQLVFPDDMFISPLHARVEFNTKLQQTILSDLKSLNGVYVQIRQPVVLDDGDMFRLGEQIFGIVRC